MTTTEELLDKVDGVWKLARRVQTIRPSWKPTT